MKKLLILSLALLLLFTSCSEVSDNETTEATESNSEEVSEIVVESDTETEKPEETTAAETELPKISSDTPWYLSWETSGKFPSDKVVVPEDVKTRAIKVPLVYEETYNGMSFKVEFFQEYYPLEDPLQAKVTIVNHTGKDVGFVGNIKRARILKNGSSFYTESTFHYPFEHEQIHYTEIYYGSEVLSELVIPSEETFVFEPIIIGITPIGQVRYTTIYDMESEYSYCVSISEFNGDRYWKIEFPIEIVEVERID